MREDAHTGNPQAPQATKKLAGIYRAGDILRCAEEEYQRLLQINPNDADALAHLGAISYQHGQWGIAEKHLQKALSCSRTMCTPASTWA